MKKFAIVAVLLGSTAVVYRPWTGLRPAYAQENIKLVCQLIDGNVAPIFGNTVHLTLDITDKIAIGPDVVLSSHPEKGGPVKMEVTEAYLTWSRPNPAWVGDSSFDFQLDRTTLGLHVVVALGMGNYQCRKDTPQR
jgi:hypothetical protein